MNKQEFMSGLRVKLPGLPPKELEERLGFYSEMIDDRIEEGLSEEEAVSQIGSVDEIAAQIASEISFAKAVKKKTKTKRRMKVWKIVLLVLGSPIWFSLLISAFAVAVSLYAVLWSVILSIWAGFASAVACTLAGAAVSVFYICSGNLLAGVAMIGAALVCAGVSIFMFFGCKAATKGVLILTKKIKYINNIFLSCPNNLIRNIFRK